MIARRDLLMSIGCLAGLGAGAGLKPRRNVTLMPPDAKLADLTPASFGLWRSEMIADPLAVEGPDSLANKLYDQLLVRSYVHVETGQTIILLMAYGHTQTNNLQLHRPEVCYPAFGYEISRNESCQVAVRPSVEIPARRLYASQQGRHESVIYWSRLGEYLPQTGGQQRADRLKIGLQGVIPDGLLARFSLSSGEDVPRWADIERFIPEFLTATARVGRPVLVGDDIAKAMGQEA